MEVTRVVTATDSSNLGLEEIFTLKILILNTKIILKRQMIPRGLEEALRSLED